MLSFVLGRRDFGENDQMITLFTLEKGKIEVLAKGVKKITAKNSAYLEPFFLIEAEIIKGKELLHLVKVVPVQIFKNIREDLEKSLLAGYICKVLNIVLPENVIEKKVFDLLFDFFSYLEGVKKVRRILAVYFLWKILCLQGYSPMIKNCVICKKEENTKYFSAIHGGCVCNDCKKKVVIDNLLPLNLEDRDYLKLLISGTWSQQIKIKDDNFKKQEKILTTFLAYHSEKKIPLLVNLLK